MKIGRRPRRRGKDKKRFAEEKLKRKQMKPERMPIGKTIALGFWNTCNPLSQPKRTEVEVAALEASTIGRGQLSPRVRQNIIDVYVLDILEGRRV